MTHHRLEQALGPAYVVLQVCVEAVSEASAHACLRGKVVDALGPLEKLGEGARGKVEFPQLETRVLAQGGDVSLLDRPGVEVGEAVDPGHFGARLEPAPRGRGGGEPRA